MAADFAMASVPATLLQGRRVLVMGTARPLGRAVAQAATAAGADVIGLDSDPALAHVNTFYRVDLADPAALDAAAAALPDDLDAVALLPGGGNDSAEQALVRGILAPRHLASALAPRLAPAGAVIVQGAQPGADSRARLAEIRAAMALRWDDLAGFPARWGLDTEPSRAEPLAGWAMQAWAMAHRWTWPGRRVNALVAADADGRYPPGVAAARGCGSGTGTDHAAVSALFLLSALSVGVTGTSLYADGGYSAHTFSSLDGL